VTLAAPARPARDELRFGLLCGVLAYSIWGAFPLFLKQLAPADALEIVAHRIAWSAPLGAVILTLRGQWRETRAALLDPKVLARLAVSAALIAGNWLIYVWAVANDRVLEASLGYYINPLLLIAVGVIVLGEKLGRARIAAVVLAAAGVAYLAIAGGVVPWASLLLAASFATYGFVRKTTPVGAMPGLFIETLLCAPFALAWIFHLQAEGSAAFGAHGLRLDLLLAFSGPMTVAPLLMFALAARRLTLTTLGFLQYIGPTGQLLLGLHYGEAFTAAHAVCFGLIWIALAIVTIDAVRRARPQAA